MKNLKETQTYYQKYYQEVVKPKREKEKAAQLAQAGNVRKRRGPQKKYGPNTLNIHLKFPDDLAQFIREDAQNMEWQAWFNQLVREKMERVSQGE